MSFPTKSIEWRRLSKNAVYHLFINNKSACSKIVIQKQEFEFLEQGPTKTTNICKACVKEHGSILTRITEIGIK